MNQYQPGVNSDIKVVPRKTTEIIVENAILCSLASLATKIL